MSELRNIKYQTSGMKQREIADISKGKGGRDEWGEVGNELNHISLIYQLIPFCDRLIGSVQVSCTHSKDIDDIEQRKTTQQVKSNENQSKVSDKEFAKKLDVGLDTARDTMNKTTQRGVWTSAEPMSRMVRVDHLDLHLKRLKGTWYDDTFI